MPGDSMKANEVAPTCSWSTISPSSVCPSPTEFEVKRNHFLRVLLRLTRPPGAHLAAQHQQQHDQRLDIRGRDQEILALTGRLGLEPQANLADGGVPISGHIADDLRLRHVGSRLLCVFAIFFRI